MGKGKKRHSSWKMQALTSTISTTMVLVLLGIVTITMLTARTLSRTVREDLTEEDILEDGAEAGDAKQLRAEPSSWKPAPGRRKPRNYRPTWQESLTWHTSTT